MGGLNVKTRRGGRKKRGRKKRGIRAERREREKDRNTVRLYAFKVAVIQI